MVSKDIKKYRKLRRIIRRKKRRQKMHKSIFEKFILLIILKKLFNKIFLYLGILLLTTKLSFNAGSEKSDKFIIQQRDQIQQTRQEVNELKTEIKKKMKL
jgi:cell division protein FtsB